ncbi:MAG TPA: hypothetical protein VGP66_11155 [Candidatus Acidoferrum sp.]|jgi:hypothetical protein|nr:hypothetical protein [Candidatus Acidoferrum sp.]
MSKKTSTAALDSFCKRKLTIRRRAPRHPAGERRSRELKKQRSNERTGEFGQASIAVRGEGVVNGNAVRGGTEKLRAILPVILRITFSLVLWTLGVTTMTIVEARTSPTDSTKQEDSNPQLTSRAALTTPPGTPLIVATPCLALLVLLGCASSFAFASQLDPSLFITQKKLISPGHEWAIFRGPSKAQADGSFVEQVRLCLTDDGEKSWQDITPRSMPAHWIETVFFLDRYHGWMFASDALSEDPDARFYLLSTADGGKHWQTQEFRRQPFELMLDMFPTGIFFADPRHGWILWHWHMMNSSRDSLLRTVDGGKTWTRLPDPPGAGPMDFVSDNNGWMICASDNQQGIPYWEDDAVCVTHDAGRHWKTVALPIPQHSPGLKMSFSDIYFKSGTEGLLIGGFFNPSGTTDPDKFVCRTRSGGRRWRCSTVQNGSERDD